MGLADVWNRTLVYFGIAEDEEWDEDGTVTRRGVERDYRRGDRATTCGACRAAREPDGPTTGRPEADAAAGGAASSSSRTSRCAASSAATASVHLVAAPELQRRAADRRQFKDSSR